MSAELPSDGEMLYVSEIIDLSPRGIKIKFSQMDSVAQCVRELDVQTAGLSSASQNPYRAEYGDLYTKPQCLVGGGQSGQEDPLVENW